MIGMTTQLKTDYDTALTRVTEALKSEGFGVLTEIDMQQTFKNKLDVDFHPYRILGACNPQLAHRALTLSPEVGMLLPCNVTVSQVDDETVEVAIIDPITMLEPANHPELQPIAEEAQARLRRVITALEAN